jgi:hypothetical protein
MAHPLEPSYNWRTPVSLSGIGLVVCVGLLSRSGAEGWLPVALALVAVEVLFLAVVYSRARAYLMVDGSTLRLRPYRRFVTVDGGQVTAVRQVLTSPGPSYRILVSTEQGRARYLVPTALLRSGHPTFFRWLRTYAPQAELDRGTRKMLKLLQTRGMVD